MIVAIDSNIILDVILPKPVFAESRAVLAKTGFDFYVSASSITDIFYITKKYCGSAERAKDVLRKILEIVSVAGVDENCIIRALNADWKDFEDCVQYNTAQQIKAEIIITRNTKDYESSAIRVMSPKEFLSMF